MTALSQNRKARHDFEFLKQFEAGLELTGQETKSLRQGRGNLRGAFVSLRGGEAFLMNAEIPPYQVKNAGESYDPKRVRKLLLSRSELLELESAEGTKGLTIVPTKVYNKGKFLKVEIAIVRGKKKFDKRETLKKRETMKELRSL